MLQFYPYTHQPRNSSKCNLANHHFPLPKPLTSDMPFLLFLYISPPRKIGTPTSLIYGQDSELNVIKDCTIVHELVPIVTMNTNGMHQHQYHQSGLPEMLDNIPDMSQYENGDSVMLSQLDIFQQQQMQSIATTTSGPPPPPSQVNIMTGVYTLQEEPEETEENAM